MDDPNLSRWIRASINDHFKGDGSIPIYFEGDEWDATGAAQSYAEVRINGPRYDTPSKGSLNVELEIGIMCGAMNNNDIYRYDRLTGIFQVRMGQSISVYRYGSGDEDDQTFVGCLIRQGEVETVSYGQSEVNLRIILASVEAQYRMEL